VAVYPQILKYISALLQGNKALEPPLLVHLRTFLIAQLGKILPAKL
jgi:hypothetical protein